MVRPGKKLLFLWSGLLYSFVTGLINRFVIIHHIFLSFGLFNNFVTGWIILHFFFDSVLLQYFCDVSACCAVLLMRWEFIKEKVRS